MPDPANDNYSSLKRRQPTRARQQVKVEIKANRNFVLDCSIFVLYSSEQYIERPAKEDRNDD